MRTTKEIDEQIQEENDQIRRLYAQINLYEESISRLKKERKIAEEEELNIYIDQWLDKNFGIRNQKEAENGKFIVFDKEGRFIKTVSCGLDADFHYVSPANEKGTFEYWLKKNRLYAQAACSFCNRSFEWYQKSFREQLENLGWEFTTDGKVRKTQW